MGRVRSAPDDPDAAGKDSGNVVGSDGPRNSSPGALDSALRMERAGSYLAAVDASYRQHAIDYRNANVEKPERETVTPAMRRIEAEDPQRYPVGLENHLQDRDQTAEGTELETSRSPTG
jgi:hypothetical protein